MKTILYEVIITVDPSVRADYLDWLRRHMDEMKSIDGFVSASLLFNTEDQNEFTCHYKLQSQEAMDAYLANHAPAMRADGTKRFGNKFSARRRILKTG